MAYANNSAPKMGDTYKKIGMGYDQNLKQSIELLNSAKGELSRRKDTVPKAVTSAGDYDTLGFYTVNGLDSALESINSVLRKINVSFTQKGHNIDVTLYNKAMREYHSNLNKSVSSGVDNTSSSNKEIGGTKWNKNISRIMD